MPEVLPVAEDVLMDPPATATFLSVAVPTLADWRTKRIGPDYIKVGRCVRYRRSALDSWLASRTQKTGQEVRS